MLGNVSRLDGCNFFEFVFRGFDILIGRTALLNENDTKKTKRLEVVDYKNLSPKTGCRKPI